MIFEKQCIFQYPNNHCITIYKFIVCMVIPIKDQVVFFFKRNIMWKSSVSVNM